MQKFFSRNALIVLAHIVAACILLFCLVYFFCGNLKMFYKDITSYMFFSPLILLFGTGFVCFYIIRLFFYFCDKQPYLATRWELIYKIIFTATFIMLIVRAFCGDFMCLHETGTLCDPNIDPSDYTEDMDTCHHSTLNVPVGMVIAAIISGIITWFTPKIRDNDNLEF